MDRDKKENVKYIACLAVLLTLGAGVFFAVKFGGSEAPEPPAVTDKADSEIDEPIIEEDKTKTIILAPAIPELSCVSVELDGSVVFADRRGGYSFIAEDAIADCLTAEDDRGAEIVLSYDDGALKLTRNGESAEWFVYNRHLIELKDGRLYYDSSPVEYSSDSFSAYRLSEDCVVECTARGQYRLVDNKGDPIEEIDLVEGTGANIRVKADEDGFYSKGLDDRLFYNVYKLGNDLLFTSRDYVLYVNGEELVPYGHNDRYVNPDIQSDADSAVLAPMRPPVGRGAVSEENEGISSLTAEMLELVNEVREQYGMLPLYGLERLDSTADIRARELAESFSHSRPDKEGSSYDTVLDEKEIVWCRSGENIAKGGGSCGEVFESWLSSKEHRAVMLDPNMKYLSLAAYEEGGNVYWELLLINDTYVPDGGAEEEI